MTAMVRLPLRHSQHTDTNANADPDEILRLQGVSWMKRKIIASVTITLYTKHYIDDDGKEHIDIQQVGTGGFKGNFEPRILDWEERERNDSVFGYVRGRTRRLKVEEIEDEWQKEGWSEDTFEHGAIESHVWSDTPKSNTSWTANQVRTVFNREDKIMNIVVSEMGIHGEGRGTKACQESTFYGARWRRHQEDACL